jgi:hypothetical protein
MSLCSRECLFAVRALLVSAAIEASAYDPNPGISASTRAANIRRVKAFFVNVMIECSFRTGPVL